MDEQKSLSNLSARQKDILEFARAHREIEVDPLAKSFGVTPQTIRRDLNQLCNLRLLQRIHGGAIVRDGVENLGYAARKLIATDKKNLIGKRSAELIANDSSLIINIGTTTEFVAEHLRGHTRRYQSRFSNRPPAGYCRAIATKTCTHPPSRPSDSRWPSSQRGELSDDHGRPSW